MSGCSACGMLVGGGSRYHPYLACLAFSAAKNGQTVEANLRAVVEYGMYAERAGITIEQAMTDISAARKARRIKP